VVHIEQAAFGWYWSVLWNFHVLDGKALTRRGAHRAAWKAAMQLMANYRPPDERR
jgi:hypothetical protein